MNEMQKYTHEMASNVAVSWLPANTYRYSDGFRFFFLSVRPLHSRIPSNFPHDHFYWMNF